MTEVIGVLPDQHLVLTCDQANTDADSVKISTERPETTGWGY